MHSDRIRLAGLLVVLCVAVSASVLADAARRRHAMPRGAARAVVLVSGLPDLALSSTARWLRHPSQVEPWAAVADLPASLDTEPAGMVIGPPRP